MAVSRRVGLSVVFAAAAGVLMLQDSFFIFCVGVLLLKRECFQKCPCLVLRRPWVPGPCGLQGNVVFSAAGRTFFGI